MSDVLHATRPFEPASLPVVPACEWSSLSVESVAQAGQLLLQAAAISDSALLELRTTATRLDADLRAGLARDAFHYDYQPIYGALTGDVHGYEALLRWSHAGHVVSPDNFLPLVKDAGLLADIQIAQLGSVAALLALPGFTGSVSVNWSPAQLAERNDVSAFAARVLALGVDPARIIVEITGRTALRHPQEARESLAFLKDLGFKVALDDFGRGHDGFAYLCDLPIDIVKIDGALVRGLGDSPRAHRVLGAIVDVAHQLGHLVVAEGVETLDQLAAAARMGFDLVQGHLVGPPALRPESVRAGDPALFGIR